MSEIQIQHGQAGLRYQRERALLGVFPRLAFLPTDAHWLIPCA